MAWEVSEGQPQTVLDPCNTPPVNPPTPSGWPETLTLRAQPTGGAQQIVHVQKTQDTPSLVTYGGTTSPNFGVIYYALQSGGWLSEGYTSGPSGNTFGQFWFNGEEIPDPHQAYWPAQGTDFFVVE
jgi:hypothetical protein